MKEQAPNFNDIRDVTTEINEPLHITTAKAEELKVALVLTDLQSRHHLNQVSKITLATKAQIQAGSNLTWFYQEVNHGGPWDIKVPEVWDITIGTDPPNGEPVLFREQIMTAESLGNWTYGYLGAALGFPAEMLLAGSWGADAIYTKDGKIIRISPSFPWQGEKWGNERGDWDYVLDGFNAYFEDTTGDVCN